MFAYLQCLFIYFQKISLLIAVASMVGLLCDDITPQCSVSWNGGIVVFACKTATEAVVMWMCLLVISGI